MSKTAKPPTTLMEAIRYFQDLDVATDFVAGLRWPDGPECPRCESKEHSFLKTRRLWKCKACKKQFSVKVGTIFEDSPIPLDKWLAAIWMLANAKNGISSHELGRSIGISQKAAWFVLQRVRLAMQTGTFKNFDRDVEVDETFIGGKARFMHESKRKQKITASGIKDKAKVMGILERGGEVRAEVVPNTRKHVLDKKVRQNVEQGTNVYTDSHASYADLSDEYAHQVVDHATHYVNGQVHTNGMENFWSLLKRGLKGTYISVEAFHLFRYLDEQVYRFNTRKVDDLTRFAFVVQRVAGKRLTYRTLIGKDNALGVSVRGPVYPF